MRALVIAEQLRGRVPGGIGTYVDGLCLGLTREHDLDVTIGASAWRAKSSNASDEASRDPLEQYGYPLWRSRWSSTVMSRLWDYGFASPTSRSRRWDVVHATSLLLPPTKDDVLTVMVHDVGWRHYPDAYTRRGCRWHERALIRAIDRAAHFFVPSNATANDLIAAGVPTKKTTVVDLGWDHLPDADDPGSEALLDRIGVSGPFLLAVGTIEPRKNLPRLVDAYRTIAAQVDNIPLLIVGPHGWGAALKSAPGVMLVGSPSTAILTALYRRCSVFVSVPLLEGFGLPVLEALSQGAVVVSSGTPSAGVATYRVDPTNTGAIAEGIRRAVTDTDLRRELKRVGRAHAADRTWVQCAHQHARVWEELL